MVRGQIVATAAITAPGWAADADAFDRSLLIRSDPANQQKSRPFRLPEQPRQQQQIHPGQSHRHPDGTRAGTRQQYCKPGFRRELRLVGSG